MMTRTILCCALFLCVARQADGVEIALRERAALGGAVVLLGDVAEVTGDDPQVAADLAATPLMPTPATGTFQFLRAAEIRDMMSARGVDVRGMRFAGAAAVAIGYLAPAAAASGGDVPAAPAISRKTADNRLHEILLAYLREQSGHAQWNIEIAEVGDQTAAVAQLGKNAVVSGGRAPWTGYQRFRLDGDDATSKVIVSARIERIETVAFATRAIERGDLISAADVELRAHAESTPAQAVASLESVIGKEAVQVIRPGAMVLSSQVRQPLVVRRGERVSVRARAAGVSVRTFATAQDDGSVGDLVMVQSLMGKERYAARVSGVRELEVFAAAATAADVASTAVR